MMRSSISIIARQIAIRTKRIAVNSNNNNNILYHGKLFVKTDTNKHKNIQQISRRFFHKSFVIKSGDDVHGNLSNGGSFSNENMFNTLETVELLLQSKSYMANDRNSVGIEKALLWILRHCKKEDLNRVLTSLHRRTRRGRLRDSFDVMNSNHITEERKLTPRKTMNAALIFKQFTGKKKKNAMKVLIHLLSDKRLEELSVQSKCAIIKSLHANGNIRDNSDVEDFVGKLILHTYGEELKDLKNLLMAGGTRFNLQKLIFIDIAEKLKIKILKHIKNEALLLTKGLLLKNKSKPIKVLSDIDDTIFCVLHDRRYPRNCVYPGVKAFLDEVEMSSFMKTTDNNNNNNNNDDDVKELEITIKRCIEKLRKRKNIIKENLIDDSSMKFAWDFDSLSSNVNRKGINMDSNLKKKKEISSHVNVINALDDDLFIEYNNNSNNNYDNNMIIDLNNNTPKDEDNIDDFIHDEKVSNTIEKYKKAGSISREFSIDTVGKDVDINNVAFLTARPKGWRSLVTTLTSNRLNRSGVSKQATLLSGSFQHLFSSQQMAEKKYANFREYNDMFPEYDYVILGDSGQGDARLGLMALKDDVSDGNNNVRGVFIHNINEDKDATGDGELKQHYIDNGLTFHRNYVDAAIKAMESKLIDRNAFVRIVEAATNDLSGLYFGESTGKRGRNVMRINELIKQLEQVNF